MTQFRPHDTAHVVEKSGKKFITYVGLQAKLADMNKVVVSTETEALTWPWENHINMMAVQTTMVVQDVDGNTQTFQAYGDAIIEGKEHKPNVSGVVALHWLRMAETRAHVRCLRQATRSEYTAREELGGE